jgi:hypothetical protein
LPAVGEEHFFLFGLTAEEVDEPETRGLAQQRARE